MLINQDFTVDRTKYIGGSDIGAILGLSRFKTPLQVWLEKTGKEVSTKDSLPLRFGSYAEEFIAQEYARATGALLLHDESAHIHPQHSYMAAHIDRFILGDGADRLPTKILECKTANSFAKSEWGQVGSDEVPMSYLCQCIWYMAITGIDQADIAVLFGNSDFRIYQLQRDHDLESLVLQKAEHFWNEHVLKNSAPPPSNIQDCQILFKKGNPTKSIEARQEALELVKRLHVLNKHIELSEDEVSSIKQRIMQQMGEAETLTFEGKVLATWKAPKPSFKLDSKRLEAEHPTICEAYKIPILNSRRLVIKDTQNDDRNSLGAKDEK
ncbi:YqaJ viral recombinase family protein [Polynucleobacter sp. MWH-UH19D]|uniref:YqaJ viral recombinase family nuclease n=1 Tax=Polynucleobacter sp. MWH-UH19D TaxID=1855610 RepID=UPI003364B9D0